MEACIEYKADRGYCGADSESVRNKYEQIQEKIIQQYSINSTDGFSNSENAEQTLTVKRIGGKLKTIRTNLKKAVDTNKRSSGGRVVICFKSKIDSSRFGKFNDSPRFRDLICVQEYM